MGSIFNNMIRLFRQIISFIRFDATRAEKIYLIKCVLGALICYSFYFLLPQYPLYWAVVSTVLVFSPENNNQLAFDRIKCNLLGGAIGLLLYFVPFPNMILLGMGIALTIVIGLALRFDKTIRTALAAVVIVLVEESSSRDWLVAIERIVCVIIGCTVALVITFLFSSAKKMMD